MNIPVGLFSKKEGTFELPWTSVELDIILLDILPSMFLFLT